MSEEAPAEAPPIDPVVPMPQRGGCFERDPETGELTPITE